MTRRVFRRPASKPRVFVTPDIETCVTSLLVTKSQQQIARQLGISQSTVSRIARRTGVSKPNSAIAVTTEVV